MYPNPHILPQWPNCIIVYYMQLCEYDYIPLPYTQRPNTSNVIRQYQYDGLMGMGHIPVVIALTIRIHGRDKCSYRNHEFKLLQLQVEYI